MSEILVGLTDTVVGAIAGAALMYWSGWAGEKGKLAARHSNLPELADIAGTEGFVQGKAQEEGRIAAVEYKMQTVLRNLQDITDLTERIKSSVGYDAWLRQTIRSERRADYAAVLKISDKLYHSLAKMKVFQPDLQRLLKEIGEFKLIAGELCDAVAHASLVGTTEFHKKAVELVAVTTFEIEPDMPDLQELGDSFGKKNAELWTQCRVDLGVYRVEDAETIQS